jgi:hypothetical protein
MADLEEDFGADTQRFQAFVAHADSETPAPWQMRAPASRIWLLVGVVVAVAVVVALLMTTLT